MIIIGWCKDKIESAYLLWGKGLTLLVLAVLSPSCGERANKDFDQAVPLAVEDTETHLDHRIHDEDEALLRLAYLPRLADSILHQFNKAALIQKTEAIRYPVCITLDQKYPEDQVQRFIATVEMAANFWIRTLVGEEGWPVTSVRLYMVGSRSSCPEKADDLRVYKIQVSHATTRNNAPYYNFIVNYKPSMLANPNPRTVIHEFGHQIGLGDTYQEDGIIKPLDQPISMMNNYHVSGIINLTRDDEDALKHLWARFYKKDSQACPQGYRAGAAAGVRTTATFCVPTAGRDLLGLFDDGLSFETKTVVSDVLSELNKSFQETDETQTP